MDRNGGSILTGTLLISLLLTPAVRSRLASPGDTGGGTESTGQNQSNGHSGAALRAEQKWSDRKRQAVEDQAKTDYRDEFNRVLNAACPKKDNKSACQVQPKDFIVAILPDPIHTHLALRFDRQIEAIEESVQDEDYIYDRAIMPWDTKVHRESDDHEKRLEALWYEEAREKNPGLMVFRGDSKHPQKALFVVIVTETPTGGVRRQQFREAIAKISDATKKDLSRPESWGPNPGPGCSTQQGEKLPECAPRGLRIVGPSFSGSLASLRELLTCTPSAKGHCPSVPLASIHASVSSHDDISSFEEAMQPQNVHLVSFLESSDIVIERFVEYLAGTAYLDPTRSESRNYRAKSIALLSEDESVYGRMQKDKSSSPEIQQKALRESDCDKKENSKEQQCMLKLYFPREISQLRAAYQKDIAGASDNNANAPPRDILRATPDVPGSEDDTVPVYSSKQMPLSQEAVMLGIVSELRRHNSQYILIRATDPLDQLFLARYLRTEYPQGRIVTIGADMLFRREAEDPRLHGVLALTTYSVVPTANHNFKSSEDEHIERVFPSSNEAATYNAMRSLLTAWVSDSVEICQHGEDLLKGSHCRHVLKRYTQEDDPNPRPSLRLYQYGWPYEVLERPGHAAPTVDDKLEQQPIFNEAPPR